MAALLKNNRKSSCYGAITEEMAYLRQKKNNYHMSTWVSANNISSYLWRRFAGRLAMDPVISSAFADAAATAVAAIYLLLRRRRLRLVGAKVIRLGVV